MGLYAGGRAMPYHKLFHIILFCITFLHLIACPAVRGFLDVPLFYHSDGLIKTSVEKNDKNSFNAKSPGLNALQTASDFFNHNRIHENSYCAFTKSGIVSSPFLLTEKLLL